MNTDAPTPTVVPLADPETVLGVREIRSDSSAVRRACAAAAASASLACAAVAVAGTTSSVAEPAGSRVSPQFAALVASALVTALGGYAFASHGYPNLDLSSRLDKTIQAASDVLATTAVVIVPALVMNEAPSVPHSLSIGILVGGAVRAWTCWTAARAFSNSILFGAAVVLSAFVDASRPWAAAIGAAWALCGGVQLAMAHSSELVDRLVHPATIGSRVKDSLWRRTLRTAVPPGLATLVVAALLLSGIAAAGHNRVESSNQGVDERKEPASPQIGSPPDSGSEGTERDRGGHEGNQDPGGIDLARPEPRGPSHVFAYVSMDTARLVRVRDLPIYDGRSLREEDASVVRLGRCPCTIPPERGDVAMANAGTDAAGQIVTVVQLVRFVEDYDGPLPAVYAPAHIEFLRQSSETSPRYRASPGPRAQNPQGSSPPPPLGHLQLSASDDLSLLPDSPVRVGTSYRLESRVLRPIEGGSPNRSKSPPDDVVKRYTQLPEAVPGRVRKLAANLIEGVKTPQERAQRLIGYVAARHRNAQDNDADIPPDGDAVDHYLFENDHVGTPDMAVAAIVVLLRAVEVPARPVVGYRPYPVSSDDSGLGSFQGIAHPTRVYALDLARRTTWVEVYFAGVGWTTLDVEPLLGVIVDGPPESGSLSYLFLVLAVVLVISVAGILVALVLRRRRRPIHHDEARTILQLLERATGIPREPSQTPLEYGAVLWAKLPSDERRAAALVVDVVVRISYTTERVNPQQIAAVERALALLRTERKRREHHREKKPRDRRSSIGPMTYQRETAATFPGRN